MIPLLAAYLTFGATQDTLAPFRLYAGHIAFRAPIRWHLLGSPATDSSQAYVFHVRNPADSATDDRTNLLVIARIRHDNSSLQTFSDTVFNRMLEGESPTILNDVTREDKARSVLWRGELRGTPYVLLDKFAVKDTFYVNVRFALPLRQEYAVTWQQTTLTEVNTLVGAITVDGEAVFRDDAPLELASFDSSSRLFRRAKARTRTLPFTREENLDGARFVWFVNERTGFPYPYVAARDLPSSSDFRQVPADSARAGDVAWWPTFMGLYSGPPDQTLITADGSLSLDSLAQRNGPPKFFRRLVPK